jgi:hypothetical protein
MKPTYFHSKTHSLTSSYIVHRQPKSLAFGYGVYIRNIIPGTVERIYQVGVLYHLPGQT